MLTVPCVFNGLPSVVKPDGNETLSCVSFLRCLFSGKRSTVSVCHRVSLLPPLHQSTGSPMDICSITCFITLQVRVYFFLPMKWNWCSFMTGNWFCPNVQMNFDWRITRAWEMLVWAGVKCVKNTD